MSLRKYDILYKEEYAVLNQPLTLFVILIITTVILIVFGLSTQNFIRDSQLQHLEEQVHTILLETANMFEYGTNGTFVCISVDFPQSLRCLVFGFLPQNEIINPSDVLFDDNTSNSCYYILDDGTVRTFHSHVRFSNRNMTRCVVFFAGRYDISLQLCQKEGIPYVAMW
ncbi:MAG: hypothetical protein JW840_04815 [Candidatus Thermoplasmatota archaeon]|nr:hypothetical protein [Candidatus Thermoplasmatota archaeon]